MRKLAVCFLMTLSFSASAAYDQECDDLARQASNMGDSVADMAKAKQAREMYETLCAGGSRRSNSGMNTEPQYVPSVGKWCQMTDGVTHCWGGSGR